MTQIFNHILDHYTYAGVALAIVIVVLFGVQIYYYGIAYRRVHHFRLSQRRKQITSTPPISIIIAVRGENERFLSQELPELLGQQYDHFEVVVVYIGSDLEYYEELQRIRNNYSYMRLTRMGGGERIFITTKQALNVGIKSAQYEALLFTIPGAIPSSKRWVEFVAKGYERGEIVVAPSIARFENNSTKCFIMRMVEFQRLRNAMARAVVDRLYYAPRSNYGFTRRLYNSTRGYNHLGIDIGDNDLYLQDLATASNTAVVLSPHAMVIEERSSVWSEWVEHMRYYGSTFENYNTATKSFIRRERVSRVLFFFATVVAIAVLPLELKLGAIALALLRYIVVVWSSHLTARRLGERSVALRYWIYDLTGPIVEWIIGSNESNKTPKIWR